MSIFQPIDSRRPAAGRDRGGQDGTLSLATGAGFMEGLWGRGEGVDVDHRVVPAHLHLSVELVQIHWSFRVSLYETRTGEVMLRRLFDKGNKQINTSHGERVLICAPAWRKGYFFALCNL